jgi:hypothetical protein
MSFITTDSRMLEPPLTLEQTHPPIVHSRSLSRFTSAPIHKPSSTNEEDTPFKLRDYADGIIFFAVGSVIRTFMVQNFEIIGVFPATPPSWGSPNYWPRKPSKNRR